MVEYLLVDNENNKVAVVNGKTKREAIFNAYDVIHNEGFDRHHTNFIKKEDFVSKNYGKR